MSEGEYVSEDESIEGASGSGEPSEAQVERLLLDNLSSSESEDEVTQRSKKKRYGII